MQAKVRLVVCLASFVLVAGCGGGGSQQSATPTGVADTNPMSVTARVPAGSTAGRAGAMPAYYDGQVFTINFQELSPTAEQQVLKNNKSINIIYCVVDCQSSPFVAVINAIQGQGPGFNPLWQEVHISFNAGVTPFQFTKDDQIVAAANAGQITLTPTTEVYRCSVIGPGKP
jgi:hypothetical protein